MCVFERISNSYVRKLNIEFKNQNSSLFSISKDILKLVNEEQNGAFIILLKNTDRGTLCNQGGTGVFDKLKKSLLKFKDNEAWKGSEVKYIQFLILSLEQKKDTISPVLIHRQIQSGDLSTLETCFTINDNGFGNIRTVCAESGWKIEPKKNDYEL
jgi:hypothetical protein